MWHNFTERGKRVFQLAHKEALRMGHEVIGTEHILLGLLYDNDGLITKILADYDLTPEVLVKEIEQFAGVGTPRYGQIDLPMSPRAKCVMDLAMREARRMGVNYIGTEHIFLAVLAEGEGMAARLLASHGLELDECRRFVAEQLGGISSERGQQAQRQPEEQRGRAQPGAHSKTPTVDQLAIDLTAMAKNGELDPVIGRVKEIQRVVQILSRRTKNNPVLIGEPGVGKTAVAEGLAQRIFTGDIPEILKDKRVMQLNVANLVAGTKYRGEFEERMRRLVKEIRETKDIILFIDEIHTIVGLSLIHI